MAVTARNYSSVAVTTTLSSLINSSVTSFTVAANTGWPAAPFIAVLEPNTVNEEIVLVGSAAGTSWTSVTRGYDSSPAVAHSAGASVQHMVVGIDFREAQNHAATTTTNVHNLASGSSVVGTTDSQTLTNKTLTSPTISTIAGPGGTLTLPSAVDTLVGKATTDTLTNKTLTSPALTTPTITTPTSTNGTWTGGTVNPTTLQISGVTVPTISSTDTLTNKTLTSPSITTPTITGSGGTLTLPAGPGTLYATSNFQKKNFLDNPSFIINQFGGTRAAGVLSQYKMDRWYFQAGSGISGNGSFGGSGFSQNAVGTPSGCYALWSTNQTSNGSATAGSMSTVEQRWSFADLPMALSGKAVTFSMYAAVVTSYKLNVRWVVNYGTGGSPTATSTTSLGSLTFSTGSTSTYSRQSLTATLPSFSGTWGTNSDGYVALVLEQDYTNTTNMSVYVADAQLELGSVASAFIPTPLADDLARCQQYFQTYSSASVWALEGSIYSFVSGGTAVVRCPVNFTKTMHGIPTFSTNVLSLSTSSPTGSTQMGIISVGASGNPAYWTTGTVALSSAYPSGPSLTNFQSIVPAGVNKTQCVITVSLAQTISAPVGNFPGYPVASQAAMVVFGPGAYITFSSEP